MMQMFYVTVWGKVVEDWDDEEVLSNLYALSDSTVLLGELLELLRYRFEQIDFILKRGKYRKENSLLKKRPRLRLSFLVMKRWMP